MYNPSDSSSAICCLVPSSTHNAKEKVYFLKYRPAQNGTEWTMILLTMTKSFTNHCWIPSLRKETLGQPCQVIQGQHHTSGGALFQATGRVFAGHKNLNTSHTDGSSDIPVSAVQPFHSLHALTGVT